MFQIREAERLGNNVVGSALHRLDCGLHAATARHHDDLDGWPPGP